MAILDIISGAWRLVSQLIGRSFREWSEWAVREPVAAAHELNLVAALLEARSRAYRRPDGWRARRDRSVAASLRKHARTMMGSKSREELAVACSVRPGMMSAEPQGEVRSLP